MSSSSGSTIDQSSHRPWGHCGGHWGRKGNWSGLNIGAMILGFVFFWPVGLFIVYWIISGRNVQELPEAIRNKWSNSAFNNGGRCSLGTRTENAVFNRFQNTQYDRIREITEEIKERSRRFSEFRSGVKQRADEEEFNQFMSSTPDSSNS